MNPFYPTNCPFDIIGFFEEFDDAETGKPLGQRKIAEPTRACGSPGRIQYTITEPLHLVHSWKQTPIIIKASPKRPRTVIATIQILCGREKEKS